MHAVDLAPEQLELVKQILAGAGVGADHRPLLFGSRVSGGARRYSDLDIMLAGEPLSVRELRQLREDLEESSLPIRVDLLNLDEASEGLRDHALAGAVSLAEAVGTSR